MIYVKRLSDEVSCDMTFTPCKVVRVLWETESGEDETEIRLSLRENETRWVIDSEFIGTFPVRCNGVGTRCTRAYGMSLYHDQIFDALDIDEERVFTVDEWGIIAISPDSEQMVLAI